MILLNKPSKFEYLFAKKKLYHIIVYSKTHLVIEINGNIFCCNK